jgi:hypothetical protein
MTAVIKITKNNPVFRSYGRRKEPVPFEKKIC